MAYTAPNDLFTSEEAILSLASSIADEDRTNLGNGTINGALDVLADALAERNVEVPPMNAGAILALADYVSGGGGGGTSTTDVYLWNMSMDDELKDVIPSAVKYISGIGEGGTQVFTSLQFDAETHGDIVHGEPATIYGVKVKDVPVGAALALRFGGDAELDDAYMGYMPPEWEMSSELVPCAGGTVCLMPIDGLICAGGYQLCTEGIGGGGGGPLI